MGNYKNSNQQTPIEHHKTAAWASEERRKKMSKVNIPDELQVENAKEYVDENEK